MGIFWISPASSGVRFVRNYHDKMRAEEGRSSARMLSFVMLYVMAVTAIIIGALAWWLV